VRALVGTSVASPDTSYFVTACTEADANW
jgi:hypothetical protein